jgi:hypothetical protein
MKYNYKGNNEYIILNTKPEKLAPRCFPTQQHGRRDRKREGRL